MGTVLLTVLIVALIRSGVALNEDFSKQIENAAKVTDSAIDTIYKEWQVDKYPNFLKSCFMHKVGWEIMKLKMKKKILTAVTQNVTTTFVASFLGSSVTAGHDSHFNSSTPIIVGNYMKASFAAMNVEFDNRNVALGNNPCTPYDVCVKYFAGIDADVVHWEQNYFCDGRPIVEQFVRQAMFMPSKPIVVFSESNTGHWKPEVCNKAPASYTAGPGELALLNADPVQLVTEINKDEFKRAWNSISDYTRIYHSAGIQTFQHLLHEKYACQGPYIKTWMDGAASWHPSVIGHKLRGAHHAYFWLLIWKDAIKDIADVVGHRQLDAILKDVDHHLSKLETPVNPPKHRSPFPDDAKCFTDYEPRPVREASLKDTVVSGLLSEDSNAATAGWRFSIYENLVDKNLVKRSRTMGYHDFKQLMYGDKSSGPLSLSLALEKEGPLYLCETPGIWGSLPKGFDHFWLPGMMDAYVTYNVADKSTFKFDQATATRYEINWPKDKSLEICAGLRPSTTTQKVPVGSHVLTLVPKSDKKIIVAWVITA